MNPGTVATAGLGLNFWFAAGLLPAHHIGEIGVATTLLLSTALVGLGLGTWWRHPYLLLGLFPGLVAVSTALGGHSAAATFGPVSFWTSALSFVAFCLASTALCRPRAAEGEASHDLSRSSLEERKTPSRWRRRLRILRFLAAMAALFPVVLLAALMFRDRPPRLLEVAGVLPIWGGFFVAYLRAPAWAFYAGTDEPVPGAVPRTRMALTLRWLFFAVAAGLGALLLTWGRSAV